ncbi:hypothetical protein MYK68_19715 [Gordonia sp. PP30]|uniref:DUF6802 family protein n=1 Tax=unclassified Gordonia (in: high G+C Gram-positive bacteria) TaxID=2657482 RepID=UPI001FFEE370|nr:DUF6802 family protein [Gordonia sp. PP30]UQE74894.1 hypothetical protein MYK68_19715 [Gordonia sp. PP30]
MNDWIDLTGEESLNDSGQGAAGGSGGHPLDDHLWLFDGSSAWDLGPAQLDADADGVADSLTRGTAAHLTVYTDTDLDGRVDRITELDPSGHCAVSDLDPATGVWQPTQLGRFG